MEPKFKRGDSVRKIKGSQWSGKVVGEYSTELTPEGYAVESSSEKGSVQIYPAAALELHQPTMVALGSKIYDVSDLEKPIGTICEAAMEPVPEGFCFPNVNGAFEAVKMDRRFAVNHV